MLTPEGKEQCDALRNRLATKKSIKHANVITLYDYKVIEDSCLCSSSYSIRVLIPY